MGEEKDNFNTDIYREEWEGREMANPQQKQGISLEKAVYCQNCGNKQSSGDKFCSGCGRPLGQGAPQGLDYDGRGASYGSDDDIEALYVKKNTEYFLPRFKSMRISGGRIKWNWAAFFVSPLWMIYRKMYAYGFGFLIVQFILALLGASGISILISIYFALMGNHLYMKQIEKLMEESRDMPTAARMEHMNSRGGTNGKAVWIAIVVYSILGAMLV